MGCGASSTTEIGGTRVIEDVTIPHYQASSNIIKSGTVGLSGNPKKSSSSSSNTSSGGSLESSGRIVESPLPFRTTSGILQQAAQQAAHSDAFHPPDHVHPKLLTALQQLFKASSKGQMEEIEKLLDTTQHLVNKADWCGHTALHKAASAGSLQIAALLIERGGHVEAHDLWGTTPLHEVRRTWGFPSWIRKGNRALFLGHVMTAVW
jgi:ankyrin repeat protein